MVSSNINEVIRVILGSIFFTKRFRTQKKHQKAPKSTKSDKSTKMPKDTQPKAQNVNKRISDYFPLRCFLRAFFIFVHL